MVVKWYEEWMTAHHRAHRVYYLDDDGPSGMQRLWQWNPPNSAVPKVLPRADLSMYPAARYRMRGIRAGVYEVHVIGASFGPPRAKKDETRGGVRIRTGVRGFAGPCLTTRPRRQNCQS